MPLNSDPNFDDPDSAYRALVEAHRDLTDVQSTDLDAALVLILANHIGDLEILREAIALAKQRLSERHAAITEPSTAPA